MELPFEYHHVLCKRFKSFAVRLDNRDGYMAGLPGLNIPHGSRFSCVHTADHLALRSIDNCRLFFFFHTLSLNHSSSTSRIIRTTRTRFPEAIGIWLTASHSPLENNTFPSRKTVLSVSPTPPTYWRLGE